MTINLTNKVLSLPAKYRRVCFEQEMSPVTLKYSAITYAKNIDSLPLKFSSPPSIAKVKN
jgi:hypothetical protein